MNGDTIAPVVSIVLPTYNGAQYIERAIETCLGQTYHNWELIIVDDGSTDDTVGKIERYLGRDRGLRLLRHECNRRLPAALNTGFANAAGKYLTWTSDDNYYRPEAIDEMVAYLEDHPNVDMVYTDCSVIDDAGNIIMRMHVGESETLLSCHHNCIGPCFLYRRHVRDVVGEYAEDMFLVEDYDYWLRASNSFRLEPYHKDLYCYRIHRKSLSARHAQRVDCMVDRALSRNLRAARVTVSTKAALFFMLAQRARGRGETFLMLTHLVSAWSHSPRVFTQCLGQAARRRLAHRRVAR